MKIIIFLLTLIAISDRVFSKILFYNIDDAENYFNDFIQKYEKQYVNEKEKQIRFGIFKQNLKKINQFNSRNEHAVHGITHFADMTLEEYRDHHSCFRSSDEDLHDCVMDDGRHTTRDVPEAFDWRDHGAVTRVKDQQMCGSCWAFSCIGSIEGQHAIKKGELIELSEQQLVDCVKNSNGCAGGIMTYAFGDLIKMGGVQSEADYPYKHNQMKCKFNITKAKTKLSGCVYFNFTDEEVLKAKLVENGPISVGLDPDHWMFYKSGVLETCKGDFLHHAVLLVGYGTEDGIPYWLIKNSSGEGFGEKGYIKLKRGVNACGMMNPDMSSAVIN